MGYIGNQTTNAYTSMDKQDITGNGGANYTLSHAVANEQEIEVFVNNVRQEGGVGKAYTVSGTALTMTGNVSSSDEFYVVFQGKAVGTIVPPDGSVGTAKLADGAVTATKLASGVQGVAGITSSSTSGTALSIDANNIVTTPSKPIFHAYGSNGWTTFSNGSFTMVGLSLTNINQGSHYNTSTYKFTAPIAGVYHFYYMIYARIQAGGTAAAYWSPTLYKNSNHITGHGSMLMGFTYQGAGNEETATYSTSLLLAANDEISLHVRASNSNHNGEYHGQLSEFGGFLIG